MRKYKRQKINTLLLILCFMSSFSVNGENNIPASLLNEINAQENTLKVIKPPRIRFLPVKNMTLKEQEYVSKLSNKLEKVGNKYLKKTDSKLLNKSVIVSILLNLKGELISSKISTSPDESSSRLAQKIIRLSSPFDPFPDEIATKYMQLNITRTILLSTK